MRGRSWCWVVVLAVLVNIGHASPALDKPAFTATPAELLAAAKATPRGSANIVVLRETNDVSYDDRGRITSRWRLVFLVATQAGIDEWNTLRSGWHPSYQDKPEVRARVIDAKGGVADLDTSRITDAPVIDTANVLPGDRRRLDIPLPRFSVGAVVEEEIVLRDREPLLGGGAAHSFALGSGAPVQSTIVRFSSPASKKLRLVAHGLPAGTKPKVETAGGRHITTYTLGAMAPRDDYERYLPGDARPYAYVIASPVAAWGTIARDYRAVIDRQIAAGPVAFPAALPKQASLDTVRAIVTWLQDKVAYSGVMFDNSAVVPSTPAEIVKRGNASALDCATLLVALLRQVGIGADLALINVGPGPDIDRDVPAINLFDHVLVRARVGKSVVWIDPIEPLMEPGRLPVFDQGRLALVVDGGSASLVTTPASVPGGSVVREVRTFELAEAGPAKVTEVSHEGGAFEADQRKWMRDTAPDALKQQLENYAKSEFAGSLLSYASTPPSDLSKPFEVTVVTSAAERAYSGRSSIDVYLWPTDTLKQLPDPLRVPSDREQRRKLDFKLYAPHRYEIENRLIVPPGFTVPAPAAEKVRTLGPFKLVETQRVEGRTLVVTFRLEAQKGRLTPAEVAAVQQAVRALRKEGAVHVVIAQTAMALAERGKWRDAIAEAHRMIKLHPKEALHYQDLAQVLVKAGAGEAARRAMRTAIALEPSSADAHVMLAWILQHDTLGTWRGFNHDHGGAVAALRQARKLDPTHVGAATDLAAALEHDARGRRFERGADIRAAVQAWRAARELEDSDDHAAALAVALAWAGEFAEAESVLRSMRSEARRDQLLIALTAITGGSDAAVRLAGTLGSGTKNTNLAAAGGVLMMLRQYEGMRALLGASRTVQPGTPQAEMAQQLARGAKPFKPTSDPRDVALELVLVAVNPDRKTNVFVDKVTRDELLDGIRKTLGAVRHTELMTQPLLEDIVRSTLSYKVEGDKGLWRAEAAMFGFAFQVYLAGDRRAPKVIAMSDLPRGAGRHALRLLAKNDDKGAERLLDWVARDVAALKQKDQIVHMFEALWGGSLPRTRAAMEVAAATLAGDTDAARATPVLAACQPTTKEGQLACDWALSDIYRTGARWSELRDHARDWATRAPKHLSVPTTAQGLALSRLGRLDEADHLLADAVAKDPDDETLLFGYADVAVARGDLAEAIRRLDPLLKPATPPSHVLNNIAWLKLAEGSDLAGAATLARKGVQQTPNKPHVLNTLAAIEAERGELGEAVDYLRRSMDAKQESQPIDADLYVHARILEQLGLTDDAIAIYRRLKPATTNGFFMPEPADLAAKRMRALGVSKK